MTVLILEHQADAGAGNLLPYLASRGFDHRIVRVDADELPAPGKFRALIVMGSKEAAYDDTIPWNSPEREFMRACMDAGTPVFGICFGAQQLCTILGGTVSKLPVPEVGWTSVDGSEPYGGTWFAWHGDTMELPPVNLFAQTAISPHAFTAGPHLGVQFHPEMTTETLHDWAGQLRRQKLVEEAGLDPAVVLDASPDKLAAAVAAAHRLYDHFFDSTEET